MATVNTCAQRHQHQQLLPFMRLPKELRLIIYELAMADLVITITALGPIKKRICLDLFNTFMDHSDYHQIKHTCNRAYVRYRQSTCPVDQKGIPLLVLLALLHSSPAIYAESVHIMKVMISGQQNASENKRNALIARRWQELAKLDLSALFKLSHEIDITDNHLWELQKITANLEEDYILDMVRF